VKKKSNEKKNSLYLMIVSMAALFASFIALCGISHALDMFLLYFPDYQGLKIVTVVVMILCSIVSIATAVAGRQLFGLILTVLSKNELNSEGNLQHVENDLVEVMELLKESVIVLSEDLRVIRCNEAATALFHCETLVSERVTKFIHPEDVPTFNEVVREALLADPPMPVTVEYRVCLPDAARNHTAEPSSPSVRRSKRVLSPHRSSWDGSEGRSTRKVFPSADGVEDELEDLPSTPVATRRPSVSASADFSAASSLDTGAADPASDSPKYTWVESTICRGMGKGLEYNLKIISRNIDGRKREAEIELQNVLRASEEQAHINAAKLRYISCIAHDLKTPLQSFCFSLDLLGQTALIPEQSNLVQQANVAVDLMKLTISQTMDISKALTGAKLVPRCTTVFLSTVIQRVQIIMYVLVTVVCTSNLLIDVLFRCISNGYGKQVPITFNMASNVCDAVITDEEWLWQMLLNLLTNACKFTDRGGIHVSVTLDTSPLLPRSDDSVRSSASSNGPRRSLLFEVIDTGNFRHGAFQCVAHLIVLVCRCWR
jgi:signal transduction histidine kinase/PAS domain-containing protein